MIDVIKGGQIMNWSGILDKVLMVLEDPSILYESKFFKAVVLSKRK